MEAALVMFVVFVVVVVLYQAVRDGLDDGTSSSTRHRHCMTCGVDGHPKAKRSLGVGAIVLMWLVAIGLAIFVHWLWLLLGIVFHLASDASRTKVCASCGAANIVPKGSPAAETHRKQLQPPAPTR